jgi:hypothetical protein
MLISSVISTVAERREKFYPTEKAGNFDTTGWVRFLPMVEMTVRIVPHLKTCNRAGIWVEIGKITGKMVGVRILLPNSLAKQCQKLWQKWNNSKASP